MGDLQRTKLKVKCVFRTLAEPIFLRRSLDSLTSGQHQSLETNREKINKRRKSDRETKEES